MNVSQLGNWLQVLGNLGIIAGLILVGIQISQNNQLTRIQLIHESQIAAQNMHLVLAGENPGEAWSRAILDPDSLTDEEIMVVDRVLRANLARVLRLESLYALGFDLYSPEVVATSAAGNYLGSEIGKAWWELNGQVLNSEFTQAIDEWLPSLTSYERDRIAQLRQKIRSNRNSENSVKTSGRAP